MAKWSKSEVARLLAIYAQSDGVKRRAAKVFAQESGRGVPELLEALETMERLAGLPMMEGDPAREAAREVIKKVRGHDGP